MDNRHLFYISFYLSVKDALSASEREFVVRIHAGQRNFNEDKDMENLSIYNAVRSVPDNAQKPIVGGRLKGFTDIEPMWRIKTLTEQFGVVGFGWRYAITRQWIEDSPTGERAAFCNIDLFIKVDGEWSEAIPGTGGAIYIANETKGIKTDDECFKKALTDAISVACKALGVAADVYWGKDRTKYSERQQEAVSVEDDSLSLMLAEIKEADTLKRLGQIYNDAPQLHNNQAFMGALKKRKHELEKK